MPKTRVALAADKLLRQTGLLMTANGEWVMAGFGPATSRKSRPRSLTTEELD